MAMIHQIPYSKITFDNDGVGGFISGRDSTSGFIPGAIEFNNGSRPINGENYEHLKAQCYYRSGDSVARGEYYIPPEIANRPIDDKHTLKSLMLFERKAIKRGKIDNDGKLTLIPKSEMKAYLNGKSPDTLDAFMMREVFELRPNLGHYNTAEV